MERIRLKTITGPNVYDSGPVILGSVTLKIPTPAASERVVRDLKNYFPCLPVEGIDSSGTAWIQFIFGIADQLCEILEMPLGRGRILKETRIGSEIEVSFVRSAPSMPGSRLILEVALGIFSHLLREENYPLGVKINEIRSVLHDQALGLSTQAIVAAAERRGIPWRRLNDLNLVEFGYGTMIRRIEATTSSSTSSIGVEIAQNKDLTKNLLRRGGIRVPEGRIVRHEDEALGAFRELGVAVAIKPLDGHHGDGVVLNLTDESQVREGFRIASKHSRSGELLVEEFYAGKDYRILVINGRFVAAAHRVPAHVVGDGRSTVLELVDRENHHPMRGEGHEKPLTRIQVDEESKEFRKRSGISLHSVPEEGRVVYLHATANISTGGIACDVTESVHPEIRVLAERSARIIGLDICGVDLIAEDISKPLSDQAGGIIEINAGPGIRMHHYPVKGEARDVGASIMEALYPPPSDGRIPIFTITGTNGKTTVTRLLRHILSRSGYRVGMTTTDGIYVGGHCIQEGDTTGPVSAEAVLTDPSVEIAVLETARGGIVKRGLGYDWSDVGIITNIEADHLGQDGIETVDDIFRIKSLVARRVREGGTIVLNADDARLVELSRSPDLAGRRIVFFSVRKDNPVLKEHLSRGGTVYYLAEGELMEQRPSGFMSLAHAHELPLTYGGSALFQVANALAAAAAYRTLKSSRPLVLTEALKSFRPAEKNVGRGNLYRVRNGFVMIDYGHNPHALQAVSAMTRCWGNRSTRAILSAPGDRSDEMIRMSGRIAAKGFDRVIVREDLDLRGRQPGETARILCEAVNEVNPSIDCRLIADEREAFRTAMREMQPGEVVVFFYDDLAVVKELLEEVQAVPTMELFDVVAGAEPPGFEERPALAKGTG